MRKLALLTALILTVAACGGSTATETDGTETTTTEGPTDTAGNSGQPESTSTTSGGGEDDESALWEGDGTASITVAGETFEFASFACYHGDDAIEAFGDDALTFAALGYVETSGATVAVSTSDSPFGPNHTVFFAPTGGTEMAWQRVGVDSTTFEGQRISSEGDFRRIVNGESTDDYDVGSFEANCSS